MYLYLCCAQFLACLLACCAHAAAATAAATSEQQLSAFHRHKQKLSDFAGAMLEVVVVGGR